MIVEIALLRMEIRRKEKAKEVARGEGGEGGEGDDGDAGEVGDTGRWVTICCRMLRVVP